MSNCRHEALLREWLNVFELALLVIPLLADLGEELLLDKWRGLFESFLTPASSTYLLHQSDLRRRLGALELGLVDLDILDGGEKDISRRGSLFHGHVSGLRVLTLSQRLSIFYGSIESASIIMIVRLRRGLGA